MPDWSYLPLLRPALDRLGPRGARAIALGAMGALARLPLGGRFVELFGDLEPPASLRRTAAGLDLATPVGIGAGFDPQFVGTRALARLGVGFVEIGPVTADAIPGAGIERCDRDGTIRYGEPLENGGLDRAASSSLEPAVRTRVGFRLAHARGVEAETARAEVARSLARLAPRADFVTFDVSAADLAAWPAADAAAYVAALCALAASAHPDLPGFVALPLAGPWEACAALAGVAIANGAAGIVLGGAALVGATTREAATARVRALRERLGPGPVIVGAGGVAAPGDALALLDAGATLVSLHSGLVFSGPALPRRINDALVARAAVPSASLAPASFRSRWVWGAIYSAMLATVALLVLAVALTRVVLPYDEDFLGMTRAGIDRLDPRLLPFMVHDRVTSGGTTLSIALLYLGLFVFGVRAGERWAWRAIWISSAIGFVSYWLWLRLGYFEPLHTLATVVLFPPFVATMLGRDAAVPPRDVDVNDGAWRRSLVAQLLFIICGIGFVIGGVTIAVVGTSSIFVQTDLDFLRTTPSALAAANVHLGPLIAHDRAAFGGALGDDGLALTFVALWGFRRGTPWLWWTLLVSGVPGFLATLAVHVAVGYTEFWHLAPVNFALVLYVVALALSHGYLCGPPGGRGNRAASVGCSSVS